MKRALFFVLVLATIQPALAFQGNIVATRIRSGANLPATCTSPSDVFIKSGVTAGVYECSAPNTWTRLLRATSTITTATFNATTSLTLPGSSSGTATIVAPAAAGTPTLTLPTTTGTIATRTGSFTTNHCLKIDASTRIVDAGDVCGSGGGGTVDPGAMGHVLTLAPGHPDYKPQPATAASTDTSAETVTFAAEPGWVSGTIVTPGMTEGGLTAGTAYYVHNTGDDLEFSFHTTVANAMTGGSPVNLSADITSELRATGVASNQICLTPKWSSLIPLYDGMDWSYLNSAEVCQSLGTLSNATHYDVRAKEVMGMLQISFLEWADATHPAQRATQDGVVVDAMDQSYRIVGSFLTNSTTTTIDDDGGILAADPKRYVKDLTFPHFFDVAETTGKVAVTSGALTDGNCAEFNAAGQIVDSGDACGGGGGLSGLTNTRVVVATGATSVGDVSGFTMSSGTLAVPGNISLQNFAGLVGQNGDSITIDNSGHIVMVTVGGYTNVNQDLWMSGTAAAIRGGASDTNTTALQGYDVDGTAYRDVAKITAGNTVTFDIKPVSTTSLLATNLPNAAGDAVCINSGTKVISTNSGATDCVSSSRDYKNSIEPLKLSALDLVRALTPVVFKRNDDSDPDRKRYGFIAEDVASVDPRFGSAYVWDGDPPAAWTGDPYTQMHARSIDIPALLAVNTKAIQELEAKVKSLEARVKELESK